MKTFFKSTVGWAMIFCLLTAISPAFPWSYQFGYDLASMRTAFPKQILIPLTAYADWHGAAISIAGAVGLLFLVATGSLSPVPWWRTVGIAVVGLSTFVFTMVYSTHHWNHFPVRECGGLIAIFSSAGLLLVACLETRRGLERQSHAKTQPAERLTDQA